MHHFSVFEMGRQNIFNTPRQNNWNGKFLIGSLYEITSIEKFSELQVFQACCFIVWQLDDNFPWDQITYKKDCRHRYSLQGVVCKNSDKENRAVVVRSLILSVAL